MSERNGRGDIFSRSPRGTYEISLRRDARGGQEIRGRENGGSINLSRSSTVTPAWEKKGLRSSLILRDCVSRGRMISLLRYRLGKLRRFRFASAELHVFQGFPNAFLACYMKTWSQFRALFAGKIMFVLGTLYSFFRRRILLEIRRNVWSSNFRDLNLIMLEMTTSLSQI